MERNGAKTFFRSSSGLPPDGNVEEMKRVSRNAGDLSPKPMTIVAALFSSPEEVEKMDLRLKVSKEEKTLALFLVKHRKQLRKSDDGPESLRPFTDFIIDVSVNHRRSAWCPAVHDTPGDAVIDFSTWGCLECAVSLSQQGYYCAARPVSYVGSMVALTLCDGGYLFFFFVLF